MLQTNRTMYPSGSPLKVPTSRLLPTDERVAVRREQRSEFAIDDALAESPASDPPAWNPGTAGPISARTSMHRASDIEPIGTRSEIARDALDVISASRSYDSEVTWLQALISLAGAVGIALLVPFAILLVGLPVALTLRGLLEVVRWLFSAG
jgi:hypothetical protein